MDFEFSEEQKDLRELARRILEEGATGERLKTIEAGERVFDDALWRALADAGLLGTAIPESCGGSGLGFFELCLLLQEVGRAVAPVPVLASLVLGALPVAAFGSEAQQQAWLPGVVRGERLLSGALIELDADDPQHPTTRALRDDAGWRLRGEKSAVPSAQHAARVVVPARTEDGRIGLFLLDPQAEGVRICAQQTADRQPHAQLVLEDARVEPDALLGDLDRGAAALRAWVARANVALCALQLGVCERAIEQTARYVSEREQFDRPVGSFQAVHQRAADAYIQVEAVRLTTWEAAWRLASDRDAEDAVAMAKYWAAEAGHFVAYACQHLHGGIGVDIDYPQHRYFIWTTQIEHSLGAAREQLARLGARIAERGIGPEA